MIEEWATFSELCERWKINEYTLAKLVIDGKLRSHNKDFLEICVTGDGWFVDSPDGHPVLSHEPLTVDEVSELIFRISHVDEFERKNGISPHITPTVGQCDATPEQTEKEAAEYSSAWDEAAKKSPIIDDINWLESQKPGDINEMAIRDKLLNDRRAKLAKIDGDETEDDTGKADEPTEAEKPLPQNPAPVNFFTKGKGDIWRIGFEGQKENIKHIVGLQYIAFLLDKPRESVSCISLYHAANPSDTIPMTKDQTTAEGLHIATKSRLVHDKKEEPATRKTLWAKYMELTNDLNNVESDLERKEIEKEMGMIFQSLESSQEKLPDPNSTKAQVNIKKSIDRAITAIEELPMTDLAAYLRAHIKTDGKHGYFYTGASWKITL